MTVPVQGATKRIAILTFSEVTCDPRILRAAEIMVQRGHEVRAFTFQFQSKQVNEKHLGMDITRLPIPQGSILDESTFCQALGADLCHLIDKLWPGLLAHDLPRNETHLLSRHPRVTVRGVYAILACTIRLPKVGRVSQWLIRCMEYAFQIAPGLHIPPQELMREMVETRQRLQMNVDLFRAVGSWATHIYANDLETLFAGVMLKRVYGTPLIYDAHELWPFQWVDGYRSAQFVGFYSALEKWLLQYTDERIATSEEGAKFLQYIYASKPFNVVYSTPSIKMLCNENVLRRRSVRRGLLYHGLYMPYRGLEEIIDTVPMLDDCRLAFRGYGHDDYESKLRSHVAQRGLTSRVEFLPRVQMEALSAAASEFDIGLLPFPNRTLHLTYVMPNKFFEYMMAGLALFSNDLVDQGNLIRKHKMGVVVDITNTHQVAERLNHLLSHPDELDEMRRNAWIAARDIYNWENTSLELVKVLSSLGL